MTITLKEIKEMVAEEGVGVRADKGGGTRIGRFRSLRSQQKKDSDFYNLRFELNWSADAKLVFRNIKLPTARQMVDTAVSHLPLSKPVIEVIPFNPTAPIRTKAVKQQDYYTALLIWNMQQTINLII